MQGTYRFLQEGVLLQESKNLITTEGRGLILRYLAGQSNSLGGSLAVGAGEGAPALGNARLTMEFDRATIYLSSIDILTNRVVFKTTLGEGLVGTIYEVGLYSSTYGTTLNGFPSRLLFVMDPATEFWTGGTFSTSARVGTNAFKLSPAVSATASGVLPTVELDLSGYDGADEISLAFNVTGAVPAAVALRFRGADPTAFYEARFTTGLSVGYNVKTVLKSLLTKTGIVDFSTIKSLELIATSGTTATVVDFDAIRVEDMTIDNSDHILVSRSLLTVPQAKSNTAPLDIEYALELSIV